jgi:WD40 repeat protein
MVRRYLLMPDIYEIVNATQLNSDLGDIADAIRAKSQGQDPLLFPSEFISEIGSIPTGASINGSTTLSAVKARENISSGDTCYLITEKYSKTFDPNSYISSAAPTDIAWTKDSSKVAVAWGGSSNALQIYDATGEQLRRITGIFATTPTNCRGVSWSPDGTRLAVGRSGSAPYLEIYDTTTTPYTKLADPDVLPPSYAYRLKWSPDGTRLAVPHSTSPFITIYDTTTTPYTKIANPDTLPTGQGNACDWSPDGNKLAVAHNTSPFITIYDTTVSPYSKIANPSTLPGGSAYDCAWSPTTNRLCVVSGTTRFLSIYDTSSIPYTRFNVSGTNVFTSHGCAWSPDGARLFIAKENSPTTTIYDATLSPPALITGPRTIPSGNGNVCRWSPNGKFIVAGVASGPQVYVFTVIGDNPESILANNRPRSDIPDFSYGYSKTTTSAGSIGQAVSVFTIT